MAGAASGTSQVASSAIGDAYAGLRDALRRRLDGSTAVHQFDAEPTDDPQVWQARLGADLGACGADRDDQILAAARRVLALADPAGAQAGKYTVTVEHSSGVQVGDGTVHIGTNTGVAAGTVSGPVTITYGQVPLPLSRRRGRGRALRRHQHDKPGAAPGRHRRGHRRGVSRPGDVRRPPAGDVAAPGRAGPGAGCAAPGPSGGP
ncbi:RIP homotypic interaction motif-containing protein [Dactylosporangium sucinum]|uniref:Uncharacterized protein n=1 Tax=Dactylosporangium sucinum TaxID=1424081 RepID=A0A917UAS1_9ACTN|nr:RIP homotypic interaction motif-containing protein [Dactylosporangium sucinum]GGM73016.1 hypothetical protein GCM10007977_088310 [Dactylosporangium sucinum]